MIWLKQKAPPLASAFFSSSSRNCFEGAACIIGKTHEALWQAFHLLPYSLSYFMVAGFLLERGKVPQFIYVTFHLFTCFFTIYGYITNSQSDQLIVGLIAQLVEYCTGIAEVMGSDPIQTWIFSGFKVISQYCIAHPYCVWFSRH